MKTNIKNITMFISEKIIFVSGKTKWEPDIWMGMSRDKTIHNKTKNNKYRRKEKLPLNTHWSELRCDTILCSIDPVYMMKKVEYCYRHNIDEISE